MTGIGAGLLLAVVAASPVPAQNNEIALEASVVRGTLGYARATSPNLYIGIELGLGVPQIDRTLSPEEDPETGAPDFEEYLHIAPFIRYKAGAHFEIDAGVRASVADLWPCQVSDCWPSLFGGVYLQPMVGWRRFKVGSRLTAGVSAEGRPDTRAGQNDGSTGVLSLAPLLVRANFPW